MKQSLKAHGNTLVLLSILYLKAFMAHNSDRLTSQELKICVLKSDSHLPKNLFLIYFNEIPLKMMKNSFYFMLKPLFVL